MPGESEEPVVPICTLPKGVSNSLMYVGGGGGDGGGAGGISSISSAALCQAETPNTRASKAEVAERADGKAAPLIEICVGARIHNGRLMRRTYANAPNGTKCQQSKTPNHVPAALPVGPKAARKAEGVPERQSREMAIACARRPKEPNTTRWPCDT